jgi:large subunit ribosomal protein L5
MENEIKIINKKYFSMFYTKGVNDKGFDGRGNYTLGVTEQIIFPEIDIDKVSKITGMDITFVTSAPTDKEAHALLTEFGIPFKKKQA